MAIKKVELLTVDANQDTLYPKTESDVVIHGNSTVSIVLDGKVDKTQVTTNATPSTIVERTATANINIGNGVFFNDIVGSRYLGGLGIGDGTTNGVPFTDQPIHTKSDNTKAQIWTSETAPIDENATNNTIAKRNNDGQLNAKAYRLIDTNGNYKGALDCRTDQGNPIWWNNVTNRNSIIWNEENLPVDTESNVNTVVKRDVAGNIHIRTALSFDSTPGQQDGILYLSAPNLLDGFIWEDTINGSRRYKMHSEKNLPIEFGRWTPRIQSKTTNVNFTMLTSGTWGRYYRIGNVCYVSGRATWTSKNNAPTAESLKMIGFPHIPKREFETINLGLYHGLGLPAGKMEIKPHLFADGSMVLFITESAGNWLEYRIQNVNDSASFAFSGWFIVDDI